MRPVHQALLWGMMLLLLCPTSRAQSVDTLFARALATFDRGEYETSIQEFDHITKIDPGWSEAYYMLARVYVETPLQDGKLSKRAIRKALQHDPDNLEYLTLQLNVMRKFPGRLLPNIQVTNRKSLSRRILSLDSTNALAHIELGDQEAALFFERLHSVYMRNEAYFPPTPFISPEDVESRRLSMGTIILDKSEAAHEAFPRAVFHFEQATLTDPSRSEAHRSLTHLFLANKDYPTALEKAKIMLATLPGQAEPHLLIGLCQYLNNNLSEANSHFTQAFRYMSAEERRAYDDLHLLFDEQEEEQKRYDQGESWEATAQRYWTFQEIRLLTPVQERKVEHYARVVYADLFFSVPGKDIKGRETDAGRVLLRYGIPLHIEKTLSPAKKPTWYYQDFRIHLTKEFPGDPYYFYDYIKEGTQEIFYKVPARTQYETPSQREPIPFLTASFKGMRERTDLIVPFAIPLPSESTRNSLALPLNTGLFLLHPHKGLVQEKRHAVASLPDNAITTFGERSHWVAVQNIEAQPDQDYELAVEFESETGDVVGYERSLVSLPDYTRADLMLSDLLPASLIIETDDASFQGIEQNHVLRRGFDITPMPQATFEVGQPLYLYFETYNLEKRADGLTDFEVEAVLTSWDDDGNLKKALKNLFGQDDRAGVSVRFADRGSERDAGHYLILETGDEQPGDYAIALRVHDKVTDESTETVRRVSLR